MHRFSDSDDKNYGAVLWYNHSTENDQFSQIETNEIIIQTINHLENMNYQVYDENRDEANGQCTGVLFVYPFFHFANMYIPIYPVHMSVLAVPKANELSAFTLKFMS